MAKRYEHYKVWLDGEMVAPENAKVSVFTSTATRGANVYEGIRAYWSEEKNNLFVWKLDPHLKRLFQNMKIMRVTPPLTYEQYKGGGVELGARQRVSRGRALPTGHLFR